jgi:hypothetical protein
LKSGITRSGTIASGPAGCGYERAGARRAAERARSGTVLMASRIIPVVGAREASIIWRGGGPESEAAGGEDDVLSQETRKNMAILRVSCATYLRIRAAVHAAAEDLRRS